MSESRVLLVPYFVQPTPVTCQSTALKMFAAYLEEYVVRQSTGAGDRAISDIWNDINRDKNRPSKVQNAHANMKWWLERHFPSLKFLYSSTTDEAAALESIIGFINKGFPVLVSVSHARTAGHIVLVIGYEHYEPFVCSAEFKLIVHDPYGRFDPELLSDLYGKKRWTGGMCLVSGGQVGPGTGNRLLITAASRQRKGDNNRGTYYLLSAKRN